SYDIDALIRASLFRARLSFFFQAEDGIRARDVTGVQTCALGLACLDLYHYHDDPGLPDEAFRGRWWRQINGLLLAEFLYLRQWDDCPGRDVIDYRPDRL